MEFNFLDVICVVMCAEEDERDILVIKNEHVQLCRDAGMMMWLLYEKEEKFISCKAEHEDKLHCIFEDEEFTIEVW